jgi:Family of unknown function (DUF5989)
MLSIVGELWTFMLARKKYWLLPVVLALLLLGGMTIMMQGSAVSPIIYTIF